MCSSRTSRYLWKLNHLGDGASTDMKQAVADYIGVIWRYKPAPRFVRELIEPLQLAIIDDEHEEEERDRIEEERNFWSTRY